MKVQPNLEIKHLQEEFSKKFPGLKLEFYKKKHKANEGSPVKGQLDPHTLLSDIVAKDLAGEVHLDEQMTVAQLEKLFEDRFGLHVQVFRRSAALWLQTTATDQWTLEVQNRKGIHSLQAIQ